MLAQITRALTREATTRSRTCMTQSDSGSYTEGSWRVFVSASARSLINFPFSGECSKGQTLGDLRRWATGAFHSVRYRSESPQPVEKLLVELSKESMSLTPQN